MLANMAMAWVVLTAGTGATPEWVAKNGQDRRFPASTHLVGFGVGQSSDEAKQAAAADLARRIEVRIESATRDVTSEANGKQSYEVAVLTRTSSDVRVQGLSFVEHASQGRHYALAMVEKAVYLAGRKAELDRALTDAQACVTQAASAQGDSKLTQWLSCRPLAQTAAQARAVLESLGIKYQSAAVSKTLQDVSQGVAQVVGAPASSLKALSDVLALQLGEQGVGGPAQQRTVAPLVFGTTDFSSEFGQRLADMLTASLAGRPTKERGEAQLVVRGAYWDERPGVLAVSVTALVPADGRVVASAFASMDVKSIPANVNTKPKNFQQALEDNRVLGKGELVEGTLKLEMWTSKGAKGLVFKGGETMKLFMRVNQPAYVRIIYGLQSGHKVPLEQAYFIDASKVNMAVEYPDSFEVAPPYGVEHVYATAFTEKPAPLATQQETIDGEPYEVVAGGTASVVKFRGIRKQKKKAETAEAVLSLTTVSP